MNVARSFVPTHRLVFAGIVTEVMIDSDPVGDGPACTHAEYEGFARARWERHDGAWRLDGKPVPELAVMPLGADIPATLARIRLPESEPWSSDPAYPESVRLRTDGSVAIRCAYGTRSYRTVARFCRAWKVQVAVTPRHAPLLGSMACPEEVILRHDGTATAVYARQDPPVRVHASLNALLEAVGLSEAELFSSSDLAAWEDLAAWQPSYDPDNAVLGLWAPLLALGPGTASGTLSPHEITPLRGRIDADKLHALSRAMTRDGWQGRPVLVETLSYGAHAAWTGRHRILAARHAGLTAIPIARIDLDKWECAHGPVSSHGAIAETRDSLHRALSLAMAEDWPAAGLAACEPPGEAP